MNISVIGAGSWGTAIANLLGTAGNDVMLWARKSEVCKGINENHHNPRYLTTSVISERVCASVSHEEVLRGAQAVVIVTPSSTMRKTAQDIAPHVTGETPIVICSKGVEEKSGLLPAEVFFEVLGGMERIAALTGPSHAEEVIRGLPTGTVVASTCPDTARFFQSLFATDTFRTYVSDDVLGAEICAAFKNVVAIAVGASYGMGFGDNTAALLMTRGSAEMSRLVEACGGQAMTCMGLAGTGDMIVTCMSKHSRNRTFGYQLAQGISLEEYRTKTHMVVEGAYACRTLHTLAAKHGVDLPIAEKVRSVVWDGVPPADVVGDLLGRSLKPEFY